MQSPLLNLAALLAAATFPCVAAITVTLTPNPVGPQAVGTSITWTAAVTDSDPGSHTYQFSDQPSGGTPQVRKDFSPQNTWKWTPAAFEGVFHITVKVNNTSAGTSASTSAAYQLTSNLISGHAAVNPTQHPLVALFSGPACQLPNSMRVRFKRSADATSQSSNLVPCRVDITSPSPDQTSMNFYIAGMYPSTAYSMMWETVTPGGSVLYTGTPLSFTTGSIPAGTSIPQHSVVIPAPPGSPGQILLQVFSPKNRVAVVPTATDLKGNVLWYYPDPNVQMTRTLLGGDLMLLQKAFGADLNGVREVDLAGNVVLETTVARVSEQLIAAGFRRINGFSHEGRRIVNPGKSNDGYFLLIGGTDMVSDQYQGGTKDQKVDILADEIIVLDRNLQLSWAWNPFEHLDVSRSAVLGETCFLAGDGCKPRTAGYSQANDWMHTNAIQYTPWDGNLIISMRHQDWVIKMNYADGAGDGTVLWRMGPQGDFTITTNGTSATSDAGFPWFSHQHDSEFELGGQVFGSSRVMTIFDNGNTRQATFNSGAHSRCQSYAVDEANRAVNLNISADEGVFSVAVGSAQHLANGDLSCDSGLIHGPSGTYSLSIENTKAGALVQSMQWQAETYRSFRMDDLYTPVTP